MHHTCIIMRMVADIYTYMNVIECYVSLGLSKDLGSVQWIVTLQ